MNIGGCWTNLRQFDTGVLIIKFQSAQTSVVDNPLPVSELINYDCTVVKYINAGV